MSPLPLSPIKKLVLASVILHVVSLFVVILLVFWQTPLISYFYMAPLPGEEMFVLPSAATIAAIAVTFVLHWMLVLSLLTAMKQNEVRLGQLEVTSILVLVFLLFVYPVLIYASSQLSMIFASRQGVSYMATLMSLQSLMYYGLAIRGFGLSALLIAASMSWYYCFITKENYKKN